MKLYPTVVLLCCLLQTPSLAQDSLVSMRDITFKSDFEKAIFENLLLHRKNDPFALAIANGQILNDNAITNARTRFYNHLRTNYNDKFHAKKNDKKIKQIYDDLHKTFLYKYEIKNRFEDIFSNGHYNCVSGTMLYALAFTELGIPFYVMEKPTHVYLVAYPSQESIVVEATAPSMGYFTPNEQFKANYIKVLKEQKLISNQEYAANDLNTLFEKHYFGEFKSIDLVQLIGLQYMNDGLYYMDDEKDLEALQQFEKAYLLYPSERIGYLLMLSAYNSFNSLNKGSETHALVLAKLSRYKKFGIKGDVIQGEFARVVQQLLFDQNKRKEMEIYYNTVSTHVQDTALRSDISFIYYHEYGRMLHNQSEYDVALPYVEKVLSLRPSNQDGISLFLNCLVRSLRNQNNETIIKSLQEYAAKYQFLENNNGFVEMLATAYLLEFDRSFQMNNVSAGEKYRLLFEALAKKHTTLKPDEYILSNAYSSGAVYYFRKGQTGKAKALINAGLAIAPNNYVLLDRKKMIE